MSPDDLSLDDGLDGARKLLPGRRLEHVELLGGSHRSVVRRLLADGRPLIVKTFTEPGEGWARETAALSVIPAGVPAPRLVVAGAVPPTVVMTDAGSGPSVADALLGTDPAAATAAVLAWATAIAALHRATLDSRAAFAAALATPPALAPAAGDGPRPVSASAAGLAAAGTGDEPLLPTITEDLAAAGLGDGPPAVSTITEDLAAAGEGVTAHCADLGVDVPAGALEELRALGALLDTGGPHALTPADACPDNNLRTGDGLVLLDFEGAEWRHVAWDVAYLAVPWPSCWCSWRLPPGVADRAMDTYRAALGLPYAGSPDFDRDVAAAVVGWTFVSVSWFLARALGDDVRPAERRKVSPTHRAMIAHRLDLVRRQPAWPALAAWSGRLHTTLRTRWGPTNLALAPAYHRPTALG